MGQAVVQVDAFTSRPFGGNPAAVCVLDGPADDGWMQDVAREMNLSETSFVQPDPEGGYRLRWFTPVVEVDLCGHATLATAHVLWEDGHLGRDEPARFRTRSGLLTATRRGDWIELDFPSEPPEPVDAPDGLAEALGVPWRFVGRNRFDCLVELDSEAAVRALDPDQTRLGSIPMRGLIATARAETPGFDFVSRFFAPSVGVPEDPVCGSAHCALAPYWSGLLGKSELLGYQASPRGGVIRVRPQGRRVAIGGQAVTVMRGTLV
jgi:PhzF family phenazine biosynthesis protein